MSLWLVPPRDVTAKLRNIMDMKTPSARSPSSFPHFQSHITLCTVPSSTDVSELCAAIPKDQLAVPVTFKAIEVGQKYFTSVYVTVHHRGDLDTLRGILRSKLGAQAIPPFYHVSLFYIDDSEPDERVKMAHRLREEGRIVEGEDGVALDCSPELSSTKLSEEENLVSGFAGAEIWVAVCDGPVPTWVIKDKITLKSP